MAILDNLTEFADAAATGAVGTRIVGDVIDNGAPNRDLGQGRAIWLVVNVATGIAAGAAGTYQVKLTSADNAALSSNPVDHVVSAAHVTGTTPIAVGTVLLQVALPAGIPFKRYMGIQEVVATQATTAGAINAFLSLDGIGPWRSYPAAIG